MHLPAVRLRDGADQGKPEPGTPGAPGVAPGAEPVEDVRKLVGGDAAAGVRDDQADLADPAEPYRDLDDVVVGRMPDRVLQQGIDGQAEPLGVREGDRRVEPAELPASWRNRRCALSRRAFSSQTR